MKYFKDTRSIYRGIFSLIVIGAVGATVVTFAGSNDDPMEVGPNPSPVDHVDFEDKVEDEQVVPDYDFNEDMEQDRDQKRK